MFPHHHFLVTRRVLGVDDAYVAFLVDFEPARSVTHYLFSAGAHGIRRLAAIVPEEYWPGVFAHIVEDAYWSSLVRDNYADHVGGKIWVHRLHETFWARRHLRGTRVTPPQEFVERFLSVFGSYNPEQYMEQFTHLEWLLNAPEHEVLAYYHEKIGEPLRPQPELVDEYYDEEKLVRLLGKFLKPWRLLR